MQRKKYQAPAHFERSIEKKEIVILERKNMNRFRPLLLLLGMCVLWQANAEPFYGDPDQPYDQFPGTLITPHTPYLSPISGQKPKVLYLQPYVHSREVIEFKQRFDQDFTVLSICDVHSWYDGYSEGTPPTPLKGRHAEETITKLANERLALSNKYDLIVIGSISWPLIPQKYRDLILAHVKRGAGLLYIDPNMTKPRNEGERRTYRYAQLPATPQFKNLFRTNKYPEITKQIPTAINLGHAGLVFAKDEKALPVRRIHVHTQQMPFRITATQYGKGRIVTVDYYSFLLRKVSSITHIMLGRFRKYSLGIYDHHFGLLVKSALWAAGRDFKDPQITFDTVDSKNITRYEFPKRYAFQYWAPTAEYPTFNRKNLKAGKIRFSAKNIPAGGKFHYIIKDNDFDTVHEDTVSAKKGFIQFPILQEGTYTITAMLEDAKGGKLDFVSRAFRVSADTHVTEVKTEKNNFVPGEKVVGSFRLQKPLTKGEKIEIRVIDTWKRLVRKVPAKLSADRAGGTFHFTTEHAASQLWDIFVSISDADGRIAEKSCYITLPHNDFKDFDCFQAFSPLTPGKQWSRGTQGWTTFNRNGVKGVLCGNGSSEETFEQVVRSNSFPVFYDMHFCEKSIVVHHYIRGEKIDIRKPNSGGSLAQWLKMMKKMFETKAPLKSKDFRKPRHIFESTGWLNGRIPIMKAYARYASPMNVIGAEGTLIGESERNESSGFGPEETKMFQEWCRKEYNNDLSALNREWNTKFKSWNEVCGIMLIDAVKNNQTPRWVDFRVFMRNEVFTGLLLEWTRLIHSYGSKTPTAYGAEFQNFDMTRMPGSGFASIPFGINCGEYGFAPLELMLSFSGDKGAYGIDGNASMWVPKISDPLETARNIWKHFIFGCTMQKVGMEQWSGSMGGMNYLTADYSEPLPFFKRFMGEVGHLQKGISRVIQNAKPMRSKVAILFSPRNHYISRLFPLQDNGFSGGPHENLMATQGAPEDAMILMNTLHMRPTFIGPQQLEDPAVMKKYTALILPYNVGMSLKEAEMIRKFARDGGLVIGTNTPGICSEHGKMLEKARLADMFPVTDKMNLIKYGKGYALYLKNEINGYHGRANSGDFTGSDVVASALKKYAGANPVFPIKGKNGLPVRNMIAQSFNAGSAKYLGIFLARRKGGKATESQSITIDLKKRSHVWEARTKKYVGYMDKIALELDLMPRLYAIYPAKPVKIQLLGANSCRQGETFTNTIRITGDKKIDFSQVCHVEVKYNGKVLDQYTFNATLQNGTAKLNLPVSFSEKPGKYQITATDAVTGLTCRKVFTVKEAK